VSAYEDVIRALGDPTRRRIFERVAAKPQAVGELAAGLPVSRPAVSQHLRVLEEAGLVTAERAGTRRVYRVEAAGLTELRTYVERFWKRALADFKQAAERDERRKR
jgi:DNA-binding transcriptional ArsR family regulator